MSPWTPWWKQTKPEPVLLFCGGCKLTSDSLNKSYKRCTCTTWDIWNPLRSCENRLNLPAKLATKSLQLDLVTDKNILGIKFLKHLGKGDSNSLPFPKTTMTGWKIHHEWGCISYWTSAFSKAMLVVPQKNLTVWGVYGVDFSGAPIPRVPPVCLWLKLRGFFFQQPNGPGVIRRPSNSAVRWFGEPKDLQKQQVKMDEVTFPLFSKLPLTFPFFSKLHVPSLFFQSRPSFFSKVATYLLPFIFFKSTYFFWGGLAG